MAFVVFDLDQTLIRGEAVDWQLWLAAMEQALGVPVPADQDWASYPVHTDHGLLASISQRLRGLDVAPRERLVFEDALLGGLDRALASNPGLFPVVNGAATMLAKLGMPSGIATGNLHRGTLRKLTSSGLARLCLSCACSEDAHDRPGLVRRCLELLGARPGDRAVSAACLPGGFLPRYRRPGCAAL